MPGSPFGCNGGIRGIRGIVLDRIHLKTSEDICVLVGSDQRASLVTMRSGKFRPSHATRVQAGTEISLLIFFRLWRPVVGSNRVPPDGFPRFGRASLRTPAAFGPIRCSEARWRAASPPSPRQRGSVCGSRRGGSGFHRRDKGTPTHGAEYVRMGVPTHQAPQVTKQRFSGAACSTHGARSRSESRGQCFQHEVG